MKRIAIVVCVVMLSATPLFGQAGGHIGIFSDNPGWSDCNLVEAPGAPNLIYVVHTTAVQANTSQFKVQDNWGAFPAGENFGTNLFLPSVAGQGITAGGTITYVGCKPLPYLLVTMTFIPFVPTPPCVGTLEIVPDPILPSGQIEVIACDGSTVLFATGGLMTINGNPDDCECANAVEESNWTRIKALYQ